MPKRSFSFSYKSSGKRRRVGSYVARKRRPMGRRALRLSTSRFGSQKYNVHMYKRWATTIEDSTTAGTQSGSIQFSLSQVAAPSELTELYDQYKIMGVKVKVQLLTNPDADMQPVSGSTTVANALNWYPKLWYVRDYDNIALEGLNDIKQRNNAKCVVLKPNMFHSFYVRPAVRGQIYLDGVTTASSAEWGKWLDCSNSTVPHYGIKYCLDNSYSTSQTWRWRFEFCYYLKFKNAR